MKILVTGVAGFIGYHLTRRLVADGHEVMGVDGMTPYYDPSLKETRLKNLRLSNAFGFEQMMLEDGDRFSDLAQSFNPEIVIHLAAQPGVRYSLENPASYVDSNIGGTFKVLEAVRRLEVGHLMLASTSSVYGGNQKMPFQENEPADHPLSLYAATKKATEAMSHSYSSLFDIPTTAFRFFTVYGPWGRPDMAPIKFANAIVNGQPIDIYNHGDMKRDFTYIDDLVEGIVRLMPCVPVRNTPVSPLDSLSPVAPWRVVNIGGGRPTDLMTFIRSMENALGRRAEYNFLPLQPGDPQVTYASADLLEALCGYRPETDIDAGLKAFCDWYLAAYAPR
ncbi:NAD-dependent epimerase/dehydratase family protein [Caulobacter mirabilis]|uniref:UDP-glucuronate 5-epimerase n=1 Tax=Caulobacter mirabilis TaxID=69666 RepID=A0A2D2AT49_9CAUL|nr:NAD-dependent epimerase/dehydratase family protein [Caulobacter mirabilis]ATQ41147.1 UDP-glucuronate 5-epimerase [Caulobacter mirabilis]